MDIQQPSPNDRFRLLDTVTLAPGQCGICGSAKRAMVDFGMSFQGYGRFYICDQCMSSAATAIGFVPRLEKKEAVDSVVSQYMMDNGLIAVGEDYVASLERLVYDIRLVVACHDLAPKATGEASFNLLESDAKSDEGKPEVSVGTDLRALLGIDEDDLFTLLEKPVGVPSNSSTSNISAFNLD